MSTGTMELGRLLCADKNGNVFRILFDRDGGHQLLMKRPNHEGYLHIGGRHDYVPTHQELVELVNRLAP